MISTKDKRILVVDDSSINREILSDLLDEEFSVSVASNGRQAVEIAMKVKPDLVLLDIIMPGMNGYEVLSQFQSNIDLTNVPVIFITSLSDTDDEAKGLQMGVVDYISKPFNPGLVKARIKNHLERYLLRNHLEQLVRERTQELMLTRQTAIETLATLAEHRDPETGGHIRRTQNYVRMLAEDLKDVDIYSEQLSDQYIEELYLASPLHDVGKVGVRDSVLLKPGKLTDDEFEEMKRHAIIGKQTLELAEKRLGQNSFLNTAAEIAYCHHEKWDGSGYPRGIEGSAIPLSARIMAVADVYDALVCKRVYKTPMSHKKAVSIIADGKGSHFDPALVDSFMRLEESFKAIARSMADSEEEKLSLDEEM